MIPPWMDPGGTTWQRETSRPLASTSLLAGNAAPETADVAGQQFVSPENLDGHSIKLECGIRRHGVSGGLASETSVSAPFSVFSEGGSGEGVS
jgi:hypothetical protein